MLREVIREAIKSGPIPVIRDFDEMVETPKTKGEQIVAFAWHYLIVPEGPMVGESLRLEDFQIAFILAVFDNPVDTRFAYFSVAKRNGKTFLIAVILLAYLVGPLQSTNVRMCSGAMARDQAGLAYDMMEKMLVMSPDLEDAYHPVPSSKKLVGLKTGSEYQAISSEARTGHGRAYRVILLDEAGQITGPSNAFTDMLVTSQGTYDDAIMFVVSTQAPSDADYLSMMLDEAEMSNSPDTVSHVYCADEDCDMMDETQWIKSNPGLGIFRSQRDLAANLKKAVALPALEAGQRNLSLNQRVSLETLFVSPRIWKLSNGAPDLDFIRGADRVCMGLDLSQINDLCAAVVSATDENDITHSYPFVFCPTQGVAEREARDRAPYAAWIKQGDLIPIGGATMDYEQIVVFMRDTLHDMGIKVTDIYFDRWRIELFQRVCEDEGAWQDANWVKFGQGFRDQSPSLENLMSILLDEKLRHGGHPLLNMAASNAIAVKDPSGNIKIDKSKSTQRIDPLIALHQSVMGVTLGIVNEEDTSSVYTRKEREGGFVTL
jgi:phage terminase large subunit-like protein